MIENISYFFKYFLPLDKNQWKDIFKNIKEMYNFQVEGIPFGAYGIELLLFFFSGMFFCQFYKIFYKSIKSRNKINDARKYIVNSYNSNK